MASDTVRILRLIEYEGPRDVVEKQIASSIHGTKEWGNKCTIRATTLGEFPVIVTRAEHLTHARREAFGDAIAIAAAMVMKCPDDSDPSRSFRELMNELADEIAKTPGRFEP